MTMMTPMVIRNPPIPMVFPVQFSRSGRSLACRLLPPEYSRPSAVKMLSVPRVAMNGGNFNRVIRAPLSHPHRVPTAKPMISARTAGTPLLAAMLAITSIARIVIAPTERSIPAVRMISV